MENMIIKLIVTLLTGLKVLGILALAFIVINLIQLISYRVFKVNLYKILCRKLGV